MGLTTIEKRMLKTPCQNLLGDDLQAGIAASLRDLEADARSIPANIAVADPWRRLAGWYRCEFARLGGRCGVHQLDVAQVAFVYHLWPRSTPQSLLLLMFRLCLAGEYSPAMCILIVGLCAGPGSTPQPAE